MGLDRLKIVSVDPKGSASQNPSRPKGVRQESQAHFERLWHRIPERFNPLRNCMERERIERTMAILPPLEEKLTVDLGSGAGVLSKRMRDRGAKVTAVDIAKNSLEALGKENGDRITLIHDLVPHTKLEDDTYDIVLCADLIGYLNPREHRLLVSELARLVKNDGCIVFSTPIDIYSEDALEKFAELVETEFEVISWTLSYHSFYIRMKNFLKAPQRFAQAWKEPDARKQEGAGWWFRFNSSPVVGGIWNVLQHLFNPLYRFVNQSRSILLLSEKVCRTLQSDSGISHAILIAKRRPLAAPSAPAPAPSYPKEKKRVWE